jgi:hypothetical protein
VIDHMGLVPMSAELTMFYHDFTASLALAAQQERERIIAMLEERLGYGDDDWDADVMACIALIKGEQK